MQTLTIIGQSIITLLAAIVIVAVGYLVWKRALLGAQQKAMQVQSEIIEAYESRIKQLEADRDADREERAELRKEIDELRGEVKGQRDLAKAIVETIADSRVCLLSPDCENRVIPSV